MKTCHDFDKGKSYSMNTDTTKIMFRVAAESKLYKQYRTKEGHQLKMPR
jgi:hypothetical protein